ncbi:MAG: HAMP domain-containing sensor histidine kinase [Bacteroidetes bacterium]|nr:HAMP domain-containing sensor histidine kinase [Bacteroidota bacterium]
MKRKVLNIIIAFICISLTGIVAVQYFWIRNAFQVRESQFNRSVNDALSAVVNKLETREDIAFMKNNLVGDSIHALVQSFSKDPILSLNVKLDSLLKSDEKAPPPPPMRGMPIPGSFYNIDPYSGLTDMDSVFRQFQHFDIITQEIPDGFSFEWRGEIDSRQIDSIILMNQKRIEVIRKQDKQGFNDPKKGRQRQRQRPGQSGYDYPPGFPRENEDMPRIVIDQNRPDPGQFHEDMRIITKKARKIKDVIQKMAREMETRPLPIEKRIEKENLVKSLSKSLAERDIRLPFEYAVISNNQGKSKVPIRSNGFRIDKKNMIHRVSLFPNDIFQKPGSLLLYFPDQKSMILKSLSWLMLASIFFTLIVILSSIIGIVTMLRQKKISDIKTDFINNMTHEFKTPIATISIAVDSINNPKVIDEPERIKSYTRIIKQENNRMNARVEQVLQMALLDSSEFRLDLKPVNVNLLIEKVAENIRLQVENREGRLDVQPGAMNAIVEADEMHLANVFMNLLDNANKYSSATPEISVTTENKGSSVVVTFADKGIGMDSETKRKIFDKFFRVTSGNIHNVKGFGLGLSYVRAIVFAHKGEIRVSSEPGQGSRFVIVLPLFTARTEV